ncbi:hypothetical protein H4582DRAFT_1344762 [Lactarius indigo]|nr:hypothetical protein H4582DRAFT_1344762 [Lactarius indigo]
MSTPALAFVLEPLPAIDHIDLGSTNEVCQVTDELKGYSKLIMQVATPVEDRQVGYYDTWFKFVRVERVQPQSPSAYLFLSFNASCDSSHSAIRINFVLSNDNPFARPENALQWAKRSSRCSRYNFAHIQPAQPAVSHQSSLNPPYKAFYVGAILSLLWPPRRCSKPGESECHQKHCSMSACQRDLSGSASTTGRTDV